MKKLSRSLLLFSCCFLFVAGEAKAQENYTEGPVIRVVLVRITPGMGDQFWNDIRKNLRPLYEKYKKENIIANYTFALKTTRENENDWDMAITLSYPSWSALDGLTAKTQKSASEFYGSREARVQAGINRIKYATPVASFLMRGITPNPAP